MKRYTINYFSNIIIFNFIVLKFMSVFSLKQHKNEGVKVSFVIKINEYLFMFKIYFLST